MNPPLQLNAEREEALRKRQLAELDALSHKFKTEYEYRLTTSTNSRNAFNKMCTNKRSFLTREDANHWINVFITRYPDAYEREMLNKSSSGLRAYQCTMCFKWHTTMSNLK